MYCTTVLRNGGGADADRCVFYSAECGEPTEIPLSLHGCRCRQTRIRDGHLQITACDNSVSTSACPGVRPRFPPGQEPRHVADFCGVAAVSPFRELLPLVVRRHLLSGSVLLYTLYMTDAIFRPHPTSNLINTKTNPNNSTILTVTA